MLDWESIFKDASWFHWSGITPAISQSAASVCLEAVKIADKKGITVSCDLNYRKNLWKWGKSVNEVMPEIVKYCDIILGNEEDAETVFGIRPEKTSFIRGEVDGSNYESVCFQLKKQFPKSKKIIITLRGSINADHNTWSGVLYNGEKLFKAPVYQITHIIDRVGGGDSFMGGLIFGLTKYQGDDQRALNFAVAASCLKHTIPGDYNLVTVPEIEQLMKGDSTGRVVR
jgi:2-dehydro-3-deoxygluconokinase